ncbi:MAG: YciI family protein [Solirubrobacteraceae bacterium]
MPVARLVLTYDYVDDVLEKRGPLREEHLASIAREVEAGRLLSAGAVGDPPTGALFVWAEATEAAIAAFVAADPYVTGGLVTGHAVQPWTVVAGA